ncbi:hypothetical protein SODALDRAFT_356530 [Sodiomyces alkalinus F11]|uniref:Uncharacterized protein n=1 Tax=Sodiomyces alkalinus (strain CBS 110278 / VKM F-3762 / F11) TaxID=1314773 RepID=A0A3N2Q1B7_SODAK|nr:hypothetical protein SODALDRAFT_356530 [Sodiomyces alkalinus F11]ROT40522.1 hypothetical protein SODALDRAFT_356530 [Sodiomyces alkalinus F11]
MASPLTEAAADVENAGAGQQRLEDFSPRNFVMYLLHNAHHELREGDTLVFIDMPPSSGQKPTDCFGIPWASTTVRVSSQNLRATGSSRFEQNLKEFGLRASKKAQSRGLKPDDLQGVRWSLDLTPDHEGEDMVFQMAAMSLTPGVTHWWTAVAKYGVSPSAASGHDDVCTCWQSENPPPGSAQGDEIGRLGRLRDGPGLEQYPPYRMIPDYCPIRHRVAILRLLYLIEGKHIPIDSAPQIWTLVAIAEIFDCLGIVRAFVLNWLLLSEGNSAFIEVLPEESLRLGATFKFIDMTRAAFRILVNEFALEETGANGGNPASSKVTLFGRRRQNLEDDWKNAIQHAARAMVDRIHSLVDLLQSDLLFDELDMDQWQRLRALEALLEPHREDDLYRDAVQLAKSLSTTLVDHFREEIVNECSDGALSQYNTPLRRYDDDRALYVDPQDFVSTADVYQSFNPVQKALCRVFYDEFRTKWQVRRYQMAGLFSESASSINHFAKKARDLHAALLELVAARPELLHDDSEWREVLESDKCGNVTPPFFRLDQFEKQVTEALQPLIFSAAAAQADISPPIKLTRHLLLVLTDDEFKYLPLWAGGNDDGTGAVFENALPPADFGPVGPGPSYRTGFTVPSDATDGASSLGDDLRSLALDGRSTLGPDSLDPQVDSASTIYDRRRVVADDVSIHSEAFTDGTAEYKEAQFEVPIHRGKASSDEATKKKADDVDRMYNSDGDDDYDDHDDDDGFVAI